MAIKSFSKLSFGVNAVVAGQKSSTVNAVPQLIANSTLGKFMVTAPVSKALGIAVGENIMFLNNIAGVEAAIQAKAEAVVEYANEQGLDIDTKEGADAVLAAFTQWFIAKGVALYDSKGNAVESVIRFTKEDKAKFLAEHLEEIFAANKEALVAEFGELEDDELKAKITPEMVPSPKIHACSGSKTATTGSATGVGCQLNFTDTAIWNSLKSDLGANATKKNRIYDVVLEDAVETTFNNGKEDVAITIYPINFVEDADPIVRQAKEGDAE